MTLTAEQVQAELDAIRAIAAHDDEGAHIAEDALYRKVLEAIADGAENAPTLARLALKTGEIDFSRWYA